jgi:hypothetical protein
MHTSTNGQLCAISGDPIPVGARIFRTSGEFLPKKDPLAEYCEQPMHFDVYADWEHRPTFARAYVKAWIKANKKNPFWWDVYTDEHVYISINPQRGIEEASVRLFDVGTDLRIPLAKWSAWLENPEDIVTPLHAIEKKTLASALPGLRERFPTSHDLVDAIPSE